MKNKAFTLIELLVVVLIIGILAAIAVPQYQKAVAKSRAVETLGVIKSLRPAIDEYILANGKFPKTFDELSISPVGTMSKLYVQNDRLLGEYYNFALVGCRLDSGPKNTDGAEPAFLYEACEDSGFPDLQPGQIYCYYLTSNTKASDRDSICRQLTNSSMIEFSSKGRAYKM